MYFKKGDDLYRISQEYGIKLKDIYRRNNWSIDHVPQIGDKIYLRGKRRYNFFIQNLLTQSSG